MEVISLLLCLLGVAILPPSVGAFVLAARALSSSIASIYGLPARAHLMWLPDSPFLDGPAAAAAAAEVPDGVILLCMEELRVVGYRPAALPAAPVSCAFCLSDIEEEQEVRELRCAHLFHRRCLDKWLRYRQRTCPLCRKFLLP